jgi:penicillin-binding protein 2
MFVSSRSELSEFRRRYRWMRFFVALTFLVFVGRLIQLQIVRGPELRDESIANVVRTVSIPAVRGRIFDGKGRLIATSMPSHTLVVTPHYFDMGKGFARLVQLLGLEEAEAETIGARVRERLADPKDMRRFQQVTLLEHITSEQLAAIKAHEDELPGVEIVDVPVRYYPYGTMASHLIGYMNEVTAEDIEKKSDIEDAYRTGDRLGRTGVERVFEGDLRGVRGWRKRVVDARGLPLSREASVGLLPESDAQEARAGNDMTLTIDAALQKIVEQSLGGNPSGAVVIMDVNSGRILAAVSKPSYDPNKMTNGLTRDEQQALEENPFRPGIDKIAYENYFPGSVFKPFTAMSALEENIITPEDVIHCSGFHEFGRRTFRCPRPHGDVTLRDAIVQSCNVFFYNLAEMTGMDRIARFAREFGFGERTGVGYVKEAPGLIPTRSWYDEKFPGQFRIGHTLNAAIGQGNVKVTLMQVAAAYAAIANGGTLYKPQIVRRIETPDGDVVKEFHPEVRRRIAVSPQYLELVMDALTGVVEDDGGTAYAAHSDAVNVAGKTGTAQVAKRARKETDTLEQYYYVNRDHAWFAAVAPAEAPEIAVIVLIEHGGGGGEHAAPVGVEIARRYFEEVAPRHEEPLIAEKSPNGPKNKRKSAVPAEEGEPTTASAHRR